MRAVRDLVTTLVRGSFGFVVWFVTGGLVGHGNRYVARRQLAAFALVRVVLVLLLVVLGVWGIANPWTAAALVGGLFAGGVYVFAARGRARDAMMLAASQDLSSHPPLRATSTRAPLLPPARSLQQIACAIDLARRGEGVAALAVAGTVDEPLLQPDERRMLAAARALAFEALGDERAASTQALEAFPTGASNLDERLGRRCIEGAWFDATRLAALLRAWRTRGIDEYDATGLGMLVRFAQVRLGRLDPSCLGDGERRELAARAQALGDPATSRLLAPHVPVGSATYR